MNELRQFGGPFGWPTGAGRGAEADRGIGKRQPCGAVNQGPRAARPFAGDAPRKWSADCVRFQAPASDWEGNITEEYSLRLFWKKCPLTLLLFCCSISTAR